MSAATEGLKSLIKAKRVVIANCEATISDAQQSIDSRRVIMAAAQEQIGELNAAIERLKDKS